MEVLVMNTGGEQLTVPIDAVLEIVDAARFRRLPLMPPGIAGVIDLRGQAIVAMDLSPGAMAVVVEHEGGLLALMVDGVEGIVSDTDVQPPRWNAPR